MPKRLSMRWLWIDRFLDFRPRQSARALKNLSLAEDIFADHFPGYPVMPAALILEGLAQTGGILVGEANDFKEKVVLAKIVFAKFQREALAGAVLVYDAAILNLRPEGASVLGKVYCGAPGESVESFAGPDAVPLAEAEIFFAHLDQSRSQQLFGDHNFVFSGELKHLLGLTKVMAGRTPPAAEAPAAEAPAAEAPGAEAPGAEAPAGAARDKVTNRQGGAS